MEVRIALSEEDAARLSEALKASIDVALHQTLLQPASEDVYPVITTDKHREAVHALQHHCAFEVGDIALAMGMNPLKVQAILDEGWPVKGATSRICVTVDHFASSTGVFEAHQKFSAGEP